MNSKKTSVLFLINGYGFGNSFRCLPIIKELLERNISIHLGLSGNSLKIFKKSRINAEVIELNQLKFFEHKDKNRISSFLKYLKDIKECIRKNQYLLDDHLEKYPVDAIVTDSVYFTPLIRNKPKVFAISHFPWTKRQFLKNIEIKGDQSISFGIEVLDGLYHRVFPSHSLCPVLGHKNFNSSKNVTFTGPTIREEFINFDHKKEKNGLPKICYVSSGAPYPGKEQLLNTLNQQNKFHVSALCDPYPNFKNIKFFPNEIENLNPLISADLLILNGGYVSLSEAIYLRKPIIVFPFENHFEQHINKEFIVNSGIGVAGIGSKIIDQIQELLVQSKKFKERYDQLPIDTPGQSKIAETIIEKIKGIN